MLNNKNAVIWFRIVAKSRLPVGSCEGYLFGEGSKVTLGPSLDFPCVWLGDPEDPQVKFNCAVIRGIALQRALLTLLDSLPLKFKLACCKEVT